MALELNPDIYRAVLESLPIGIYLTDRHRQILFWNSGAERITGYLGQEVIGHFCPDNLLMHCDENGVELCGCACPLAQTMQDGRPGEANIFLRHKEGQRVPVHVRSIPVRDEFGVIIGAAECFEKRSSRHTDTRASKAVPHLCLDEVTEIPDERAILAGLGEAVERFTPSQVPFGVLPIGRRSPGPFAARLRVPGDQRGVPCRGANAFRRHAAGRSGGPLAGGPLRGAGTVSHRGRPGSLRRTVAAAGGAGRGSVVG